MERSRLAGSRHRKGVLALLLLPALIALGGCGGDEAGGGSTLTWFIFNEPSGAPATVAERCSEESDGRYTIEFEDLPLRADQQREQLVRRLGAEDDSIDIIGMDVIWTGEFANAGWIEPFPADVEQVVSEERLPEHPRDRELRGPALRGADLDQHRAALVSQRPGRQAAEDVGRDDRRWPRRSARRRG